MAVIKLQRNTWFAKLKNDAWNLGIKNVFVSSRNPRTGFYNGCDGILRLFREFAHSFSVSHTLQRRLSVHKSWPVLTYGESTDLENPSLGRRMRVTLQSGPGPFMGDDPYKWTQLKSSGIANTGKMENRWPPQTVTNQHHQILWPLFTGRPNITLFMTMRPWGQR